ncbi:hypothetical protein [Cryobacterium sp. M91]|uniref:hypothetical protein n=1 Tax=Cryobacterium sp. M91 TaxID=2048294 RepID=UPI000CE367B4|nr:hypothetical protein [Cryobacterium sp. M91]
MGDIESGSSYSFDFQAQDGKRSKAWHTRDGRLETLVMILSERAGAEVHVREVAWGQVFTPAAIEQARRGRSLTLRGGPRPR